MPKHVLPALCALILLTACTSPQPPGPDAAPPHIRVAFLNGVGSPNFDSDEDLDDACAKVRDFPTRPARVAISLHDEGGLARVNLRVGVGEIIDSSVVGASRWTVTNSADSVYDRLEVTFPGLTDGRVLTSALIAFDVTSNGPQAAILTEARDLAGNPNALYQIDIRSANDPVICRGQPRG